MQILRVTLFGIACLYVLLVGGCSSIWEGMQLSVAHALVTRAEQSIEQSEYDSAIADLAVAITLDPQEANLYLLRGQMYLNLYEWDKSLNDLNTAIELAPEYADAYFQRGVLYYSILQTGQELREEALADFQHYLELAPDGQHAEQAREYAAKIEAELAALDE